MKTTADNWIEFWDSESVYRDTNWQTHMDFFVNATRTLMQYGSQDTVLDIGCGSGLLAAHLKDEVKEVYLADTSARFFKLCQARFEHQGNVFCHKLDKDRYTDLSVFSDKKFSIIVCLSVVQYYRNINEVEQLIKEVHRISQPGARFLIGDIPRHVGIFTNTFGLLKQAFKNKCFHQAVGLLFRLRFSLYRKVCSSARLLTPSVEELDGLIRRLDLNAEILDTAITASGSRMHLLIKF